MGAHRSGRAEMPDFMPETARRIDRIDTTPRFTAADVARLNARFEGVDTETMLREVIGEKLLGELAVVSSFGTESAVLLDLVARADPATPVLFLETGKMFDETLAYRDTLVARLGLTAVCNITPDPEDIAEKDATGLRWSYDPDGCCEIRKVLPLARAMRRFDSSITGRKAFQASTRSAIPRFELDGDRIKFNPLANWTKTDLESWFEQRDLPRHPLEAKGYPSIGCAPCTSIVKPGEDPRAGRWRGWDKTECGIHGEPLTNPGDEPVF